MRSLEDLLRAREVFGMRLGLERMRLLLAGLGEPQRAFRAMHVVGTNGKTSTTLCCAAVLGAHGLDAGAYISPHVRGLGERVQAGGAPLAAELLATAVERVEAAAVGVDAAGVPLTQFEVLTAAAFLAHAMRGTEVVVVEAGLGGRHDATNVLGAPVVVLTNVALDHVAQLGPTPAAIAAEKLAVLRSGADLVVGPVAGALEETIRQLAAEAGTVTFLAGDDAGATYRERNARLAELACSRFLGARFDPALARSVADAVRVPGRLQVVGAEPLTLLDGAHNPHGASALAAELPAATGRRRPLVAVIAILADKDVDGVCRALSPVLDHAVATQSGSPRALAADALARRLAAAGVASEVVTPPPAAVAAARARAGPDGAVIVCGSLTLLADLAQGDG